MSGIERGNVDGMVFECGPGVVDDHIEAVLSRKQEAVPEQPIEPTIIDIDGVPTPMTFSMGDRQVTADEWNLAHSVSGTTLRAACAGEGLPVSGTNAARARRLTAAGLTRAQVEERYGWRARRAAGPDQT